MLKVNNRNSRKRCEIYSKLTKKALERLQQRRFGAIVAKFEQNLHHYLVYLFLTLIKQLFSGVTKSKVKERL